MIRHVEEPGSFKMQRSTSTPSSRRLRVAVVRGVVAVVLLAALAAACTTGRTPDRGGPRIVVLGSSTAEGTGPADPENAWVARYRRYVEGVDPEAEVVNLARGGYTTYQILPSGMEPPADRPAPDTLRNVTKALEHDPDALVINLPSNDAARGFALEEQLRNYDAVLAAARAEGIPVWVATTQPRNLDAAGRRNLEAMRDATHDRFGDRAVDFWTGLARPDGTIDPAYDSGDHVHLNDEAHRLLFERVRDAGVLEAARRRARR